MIELVKKEQSLYRAFEASATRYAKRTALIYMGHKYTYKHVLKMVHKFANGLKKMGVGEKSVVTVCLPNIPDAIYLLYAISQLGGVANLVHPLFNDHQMEENLRMTGSKVLFCLDTSYLMFVRFAYDGVSVISCSPTSELPVAEKVGYFLKNKGKLPRGNVLCSRDFYKESEYLEFVDNYLDDNVYLHSGGTSGKSKTIGLSSYAINALVYNGQDILDLKTTKNQHMLAVLPIFHGFGLAMGVHAMLVHGGVDTLMPKFSSKETVKYIAKNELNFIVGVPQLYEALLNNKNFNGKKLCNLNIAFVGGDFVGSSLITRFNERMIENGSMCRLREGYGLTETVTVCSVNTHKHNKTGSVGRGLNNVKFKVVDPNNLLDVGVDGEGELLVSGETLMNHYVFDSEIENKRVFVEDEKGVKWVRTGDFVSIDKDGYVYFKQRIKRIIKVNGIPVFPSEVEDVVSSLDVVYEAAVIGVKDAKRGNAVKVFISLNKNVPVDESRVKELVEETIVYKCGIYAKPKEIVVMEKLPHTIVGKIDVNALK